MHFIELTFKNKFCIHPFELVFQVSSDKFPEVESLGHKAVQFLIFEVALYCSPQRLHPLCSLQCCLQQSRVENSPSVHRLMSG